MFLLGCSPPPLPPPPPNHPPPPPPPTLAFIIVYYTFNKSLLNYSGTHQLTLRYFFMSRNVLSINCLSSIHVIFQGCGYGTGYFGNDIFFKTICFI